MINKDSEFDDLTIDYVNRFGELRSSTQVLSESFFRALDRAIIKRYKREAKLMDKLDNYRLKALKQAIRKDYGLCARIKRALGLAPKLSEASADAGEQAIHVEQITDETQKLEQLQKELLQTKLELEQLQKQQIEQLEYNDDNENW